MEWEMMIKRRKKNEGRQKRELKNTRSTYKKPFFLQHFDTKTDLQNNNNTVNGREEKRRFFKRGLYQVASTDKISSSAHQSGESLGVAWSGEITITSLNLEVTSFIVGLCLGSGWMQSWITSQITSSSLFLKDMRLGSIMQLMLLLSFK